MAAEPWKQHRGAPGKEAATAPSPNPGADLFEISNGEVIQDLIDDLLVKQQALSALIDSLLAEEAEPPGTLSVQHLGRLMALHSQNASRLGRLLRDKRALSGEAADGIAAAIAEALDELSSEWGVEL